MLTSIARTAHKALYVGKRRLCYERKLTYTRDYATHSLELFDPHIDPTDTEVKKRERWAVTLECVRDATLLPPGADFGNYDGDGSLSRCA